MKSHSPVFTTRERALVIVVALVAFFLGMQGFAVHYRDALESDQLVSLSSLAYSSLNLFLLQWNGEPMVAVPWQLDIARWLAPLSLSYAGAKAIIAVMGKRYLNWHIQRSNNHAIVCGLNALTIHTIETLRDKQVPVVLVTPCVDSPLYTRALQSGALVVEANDQDPGVLARTKIEHARYLIAATPRDLSNVDLALEAAARRRAASCKTLLKCATFVTDASLADALYEHPVFARDDTAFAAHITEPHRLLARLLLQKYGPDRILTTNVLTAARLSLMIMGDDDLVDALVLRLGTIGYYGQQHAIQVTLVGKDADVRRQRLEESVPALSKVLSLQSYKHTLNVLNFATVQTIIEEIEPAAVYLSERTVESSLTAIRILGRLQLQVPVIVSNSGSHTASSILKDVVARYPSFVLADLLKECGNYDVVLLEKHDSIAQAIHEDYVAQQLAKGDTQASNTSLVDWRNLPESLKDANRNQADHVDIKCRLLLGRDQYTAADVATALNQHTVEQMAQIEHQRWVAEKLLGGWQYTEGKKNAELRLSPNLCGWENLSEADREKDREAARNLPALVSMQQKLNT